MALLSLSIKRPSEFLKVPPSPLQSLPVVDAAFSPPSPADSPVDGYLQLPLQASGTFNGGPERAKKRRKQERPSLFVDDQNSCVNDDDIDQEPGAAQSRHIEQPSNYAAWHDMPILASDTDVSLPEKSPEACLQEENGVPISMSELHPSSAVVKPVQTELSTESSPVQTSSSLSSMFTQHLPSGYPSSPAVGRVASSCGGAGSDGEGEGSDGGVPETCPECRKVFKRRVYLQRHMAREHWSTAKVFKCDKCAYETKHQSNLLVHRRTHTG